MDIYYGQEHKAPLVCPFGIFADQAGYFPGAVKKAVLTSPAETFRVETPQGECRYEGKPVRFGNDRLSGDDVYIADFTGFSETGKFRIAAGELRSAFFEISEGAYKKLFDDSVKAFYYLRCGCALEEKHAGEYSRGICHDRPALLYEDRSVSLDVTGGWHDAGDYGRYSTAAACALAHLLYAYRLFPGVFNEQKLNVPESGLPCLLAECRVELEWLLKMQRSDGAVWHKATTLRHAPFVMPEKDDAQIYVFPVSSSAAADFAAVCALASGVYRGSDADFSEKLRAAAEKSFEWLEKNPEFLGFSNPPDCDTGDYRENDDISNRYWASAEMYALTGGRRFHEKMKEYAAKLEYLTGFGYTEMSGFGSLAYLLCGREKDEKLAERLKSAFNGEAQYWLKSAADESGYGVSMHDGDFYWGSNMNVLRQAMVYIAADVVSGSDRWREYAAAQLHYLLGVNPTGYSYVTGSGDFCCRFPHLRTAHADGVDECIPGFICGGPNNTYMDESARELLPEGLPPMKCYVDDVRCYSLNEVAIYWNSPLVFVLAYLLT